MTQADWAFVAAMSLMAWSMILMTYVVLKI